MHLKIHTRYSTTQKTASKLSRKPLKIVVNRVSIITHHIGVSNLNFSNRSPSSAQYSNSNSNSLSAVLVGLALTG